MPGLPIPPPPSNETSPRLVPHSVTITGRSDIGRIRKRNEDSFALRPSLGVAVVADGMGGHPGGDVASRIAADISAQSLGERVERGAQHEDRSRSWSVAMSETVLSSHSAIQSEAAQSPELEGMGTTITAMVVDAESDSYILGQVGDSRAYRFVDGELVQLTTDDTWVQERVDAKELTPEQAKRHPFGHILTQCLGLVEPPTPGVLEGPVAPGELYLLCTDGLVGMIDDEEIAALLAEAFTKSSGQTAADEAAEALIAAANEAGGYDNITVAIVLIGAAS